MFDSSIVQTYEKPFWVENAGILWSDFKQLSNQLPFHLIYAVFVWDSFVNNSMKALSLGD